jgi:hypothetical protein
MEETRTATRSNKNSALKLIEFYISLSMYFHLIQSPKLFILNRGRRGRDLMAVGFTITYAINPSINLTVTI